MSQYTGNYFTIKNSVAFDGDTVNVLEYLDANGSPNGTCIRCGRPLRRHWWTVQTADDDAVYGNIGPECIKKLL